MRRRIIYLYEHGKATREIAAALGYCVAAVRRIRQPFRERGTLVPPTHLRGGQGRFTPRRQHQLRELLVRQSDATLAELAGGMDFHVPVSTLDRWVKKLGFTFKKSPSGRRSRRGPTCWPGGTAGTPNSKTFPRKS